MEDNRRILIVDDEQDICEILKVNLDNAGFSADTVNSAEEALMKDLTKYDMVLLDVMLEGMSGFKLAEIMRKNPLTADVPIIFATARDTEDDTVHGLGIGGDDYIAKPFSVREVVSRVGAVLRRASGRKPKDEEEKSLSFKTLKIDLVSKSVTVDGERVEMTRTEMEILRMLMSHPSTVFSRDEILREVWPEEVIVLGRTVDVNITRLRKKTGRYGACIATRHGYGYYFDENAEIH